MKETKVSGKKYRVWDEAAGTWKRMSFWTNASDVEYNESSTVKDQLDNLFLLAHPVGSIYMSVNSVSPASLFGGTWEQIKDTFLLAAGTTYPAGISDGKSVTALDTSHLPKHTHTVPAHDHGLNSHTHTVPAHAHGLNSHTHSIPAHTHTLNGHTHSIPALSGTAASAGGSHTHTASTKFATVGTTNSGAMVLARTSSDNVQSATENTGSTSIAHTHTVSTTASTTGANTGNTSSVSATSGTASGNTADSSTITSTAATGNTASSTAVDSGAVGSGAEFSIMPPYYTVYMWKRTA